MISAAVVAAMLAIAALPAAEASSEEGYASQLDENGQGLYSYMEGLFETAGSVAELEVSYTLTSPVLFADESGAVDYADSLVNDVLAALYLSDPYPIWLWDYPVTTVSVDKVTGTAELDGSEYRRVYSVSFILSVPEEYADSVEEAVAAVDAACSEYTGTAQEIAVAVNDALRGVTVTEDEEGAVSTIYDALVTGESSSAGIAAAFTHLCVSNGVTAATVKGDLAAEDGTSTGYWNAVLMDGSWYAVDCTLNSATSNNCLLAGWSTSVTYDGAAVGFGATRSADLYMASPNSLAAPSIVAVGVDWSTEPSFLEEYGEYIALAVIMLVIAATLGYAIHRGNI